MSTRIATNVDSLRGLYNLQQSSQMESQALQRLSTGTQLNSAADNPSGLIASQNMQMQITGIQQSITNANDANNVLSTADGALGQVDTLLNQIRGLVQQGVNSGAMSTAQIQANQSQIDAALAAINQISSNTSFNGTNLLDGSKAFTTAITSANSALVSDYQVSSALFGTASSVTVNTTVVSAATQATLTYNGGNLTSSNDPNGVTLQVSGSTGSQVVFLGAGSTLADMSTAINANTSATGVTASVSGAVQGSTSLTSNFASTTIGTGNAAITLYSKDTANAANVNITFVNGSGNNTATSAAFNTGNNVLTVTLGTNGSGTVNANANQVLTAIAANSNANAAFTGELAAGSNGSGTVGSTSANATLTTTTNAVTFTDARTDAGNSLPNVSVNFVAGNNNQALSFAVNGNAVTVYLATDSNGVVTTTASALNNFLTTDTSANTVAARSLISLSSITGNANSQLQATASAANLSGGVTGNLVLTSSDYGSAQFVGITALSGTFTTYSGSTAATRATGTDVVARINGQQAYGQGLQASINNQLLAASVTLNNTGNVAGASVNFTITGGGSLFQVGANVNTAGQVGVGINAVNTAELGGIDGKLYQLGTGAGKSLLDVGNNGVSGSKLVSIINESLNRVDNLRAQLGAVQSNTIQSNINTLNITLQNLSNANSQITDTDFAAATAQLTKAQTLVQAGVSVLQIANNIPQQILSLLPRG